MDDSPPASDQARPPRRRPPLRLLGALAWLATIGAAAAMAFGRFWPAALTETSPAHVAISFAAFLVVVFWFQIGLGLLIIALFAAAMRRWRLLMAAGLLAAVGLAPDVWMYRPRSQPTPAPGADVLTLLSVNLLYSRADDDALRREIDAADPDVIVFQEFSDRDAARLDAMLAAYPHRTAVPRDDAFGQAVYSRRPFLGTPRPYPPGSGWTDPQITVELDLGGKPIRVTNIHLMCPVGLAHVTEHRVQAARLADLVRADIEAGHDVILAGDFNATPGTPHYRAMEHAGLRESHPLAGSGRGTTWCRTTRLAYLPGIRLDHIFMSPGLTCLAARTGGDTGSDHRPVLARITRTPAASR